MARQDRLVLVVSIGVLIAACHSCSSKPVGLAKGVPTGSIPSIEIRNEEVFLSSEPESAPVVVLVWNPWPSHGRALFSLVAAAWPSGAVVVSHNRTYGGAPFIAVQDSAGDKWSAFLDGLARKAAECDGSASGIAECSAILDLRIRASGGLVNLQMSASVSIAADGSVDRERSGRDPCVVDVFDRIMLWIDGSDPATALEIDAMIDG